LRAGGIDQIRVRNVFFRLYQVRSAYAFVPGDVKGLA